MLVESISNGHTSNVGEVYRIPNTDVTSFIQRYESLRLTAQATKSFYALIKISTV